MLIGIDGTALTMSTQPQRQDTGDSIVAEQKHVSSRQGIHGCGDRLAPPVARTCHINDRALSEKYKLVEIDNRVDSEIDPVPSTPISISFVLRNE
jgi:hypothetical protein